MTDEIGILRIRH